MAEEKTEPREINFRQMLPWTELFRSFQVALDPKKLLLAAAGIMITAAWWWLWSVIFYTPRERPDWGTGAADKYTNWPSFQQDRQKWNLLHEAAGNRDEYTDANDLAADENEFTKISAPISAAIASIKDNKSQFSPDEGKTQSKIWTHEDQAIATSTEFATRLKPGEFGVKLGDGKEYVIQRRPHGALRKWPFEEDRGPNPYLLVTGRAGAQWESGHFGEWFLTKQFPVLIEPLVKFLKPVVFFLDRNAGFWNRVYFLIVILGTLATWAFFGGAITRMAAVQVARNEKISLSDAVKFVCARYSSFLTAPLFPLAFVAVVGVLLALFGLVHMIPILGEVWDGLLWPLVLLAGLAMAVVLVGLVGWPMMYATISAEGSDSFDAISRSYSYVYQSPWQYIWYCLVAIGYGAVVVFFIGFMGSLIVYLGKLGMSTGTWEARDPAFLFVWAPTSFGWQDLLLQGTPAMTSSGALDPAYLNSIHLGNKIGTLLVTVWLYAMFLVILGFGYSYFWSASTIIYLLMRRKVDDTDMDEVYLEEDEAEESYSASTTISAPSPPAAAGPSLTMVESPTLRGPPPEPPPAPPREDVSGAVHTGSSGATGEGGLAEGGSPGGDGSSQTGGPS